MIKLLIGFQSYFRVTHTHTLTYVTFKKNMYCEICVFIQILYIPKSIGLTYTFPENSIEFALLRINT